MEFSRRDLNMLKVTGNNDFEFGKVSVNIYVVTNREGSCRVREFDK